MVVVVWDWVGGDLFVVDEVVEVLVGVDVGV